MASPFPGMNPYFERLTIWRDFHTEFLTSLRRLLIPQVTPEYFVQIDEHTVPQPDFEGIPFLEIRDRERRELITVIELLSPSNKNPGQIASNISRKDGIIFGTLRISLRLIFCAGGSRCLPRGGRNVIIPSW